MILVRISPGISGISGISFGIFQVGIMHNCALPDSFICLYYCFLLKIAFNNSLECAKVAPPLKLSQVSGD